MQIRFLWQFVRHDIISQKEANEIYYDQEENVSVLGMKLVKRNRRMRTSYKMPKSYCVKYPEMCYEVHTTMVAWTPDELSCGRNIGGVQTRGSQRKLWKKSALGKEWSLVVTTTC